MARRALVLATVLVFVIGVAAAVGGAPNTSSNATPNGGSPAASTTGTPNLLATVQARGTSDAVSAAQTVTAVATQNAELQAALVRLATSEATARQAAQRVQTQATAAIGTAQAQLASGNATIAALSTEVGDLEASATANAIPTATPTETPTPTMTPTATLMPSPTATETPQPTPTPLPKAGDVLYSTSNNNGEFKNWSGTPDWKIVHGSLVSDGTNEPPHEQLFSDEPVQMFQPILAPFTPGVADYAIEVQIQFVSLGQIAASQDCSSASSFGIVARSTKSGGYDVGIALPNSEEFRSDSCNSTVAVAAAVWDSNDLMNYLGSCCMVRGDDRALGRVIKSTPFDPGFDWHTYRLEVNGNQLTLLIDGKLVLQLTDNRYLDAGQIGLWSDAAQINVRSFKVIAL